MSGPSRTFGVSAAIASARPDHPISSLCHFSPAERLQIHSTKLFLFNCGFLLFFTLFHSCRNKPFVCILIEKIPSGGAVPHFHSGKAPLTAFGASLYLITWLRHYLLPALCARLAHHSHEEPAQ